MQNYSNSDNSSSYKKIESATTKKTNAYLSNTKHLYVGPINTY